MYKIVKGLGIMFVATSLLSVFFIGIMPDIVPFIMAGAVYLFVFGTILISLEFFDKINDVASRYVALILLIILVILPISGLKVFGCFLGCDSSNLGALQGIIFMFIVLPVWLMLLVRAFINKRKINKV